MRRFWIAVGLLLVVAVSAYGGYTWRRWQPQRTPTPAPQRLAPQPTEYGTWLAHAFCRGACAVPRQASTVC